MNAGNAISLIDYGAGNVPSVERALQRLGAATLRVSRPEELCEAKAIVLPGVGHYAALIRALDELKMREALLDAIQREVPFLGICLGLQALYFGSEEAPNLAGLKLIRGSVRALPNRVKLPHMGWNRLRVHKPSRLLDGLGESDFFYFAHTFAVMDLSDSTIAVCEHGTDFAAVIECGSTFATQFHPEKSGAAGARLLQNFLRIAV